MVTNILISTFGAVIAFLFARIQYKINKMQEIDEERHEEYMQMRIAERELLLAEAKISALSARCIRGEQANGDLEKAEDYLAEKKHNVQNLTTEYAIKAQHKRR